MGKGHKDRRREKRAREIEEREHDVRELKQELEEETEQKFFEQQTRKQQVDEQIRSEKSLETSASDTDSGLGSSTTISTDSPKISKAEQQDELVDKSKQRMLIKGLHNIGNTCFFNVIIQSIAHTPILTTRLYEIISTMMKDNEKKYPSTTTAQLMNIFNEFSSTDKKKPYIDPKPLFNSLIQRIPAYEGYDQHDSHELFMNLMLILRAEEIKLRKLQPNSVSHSLNDDDDPSKIFCLIGCNEPYTTYDSVFGGHLLDVITCKKCGKSLMKLEPFLGLLLPLTDRMTTPAQNYRNRRKREDYMAKTSKKDTKTLSNKQQKALKKQEKKNLRRSAGSGKIKGRQAAKKKVEEQLPLEESPSSPPTDETVVANTENETSKETAEVKGNTPNETTAVEENEVERAEDENADDEENEEDEEENEGPLTTVESTCMLADMVSKLTLIHETTSRPLPFVDESLSQKFLNCSKTVKESPITDETDDIHTLEQCFQRYFKPETLSGENSFDCYYCRSLDRTQKKVLTEAVRQTIFFQLPPVLPLFLKRFQMYGSYSEKINKFIEFPLQLDLTDRCSTQITSIKFQYSLYAVIEHSGTLRSGHYTVYIKHSAIDSDVSRESCSKPLDYILANLFKPSPDQQYQTKNSIKDPDPSSPPPAWYHISDNTIHKVPESKVLEAHAYVLFYRRI
ncbi:unnamed protein product [Adineta ricciae]|uniref:Ubiquitin carboxyl-terminal hydrolase n=1 Tax=Adineta ricciae TaxID=249248 RepID=A0A813TWG6_ADIRI|nr:unnamed protein product [Adineta ricciae]